MKAKLEFDLPEDNVEYKHANKGVAYSCALWDMMNFLRNELKYDHNNLEPQSVDYIQQRFFKILDSHDITLGD